MKTPPDSFAQVSVRPSSPDASKPTPAELAIASATSDLTMAIKKHQSKVLSLLSSIAPGETVSALKIQCLRADNVSRMTTATIRVQQAAGRAIGCWAYQAKKEEEQINIVLFVA